MQGTRVSVHVSVAQSCNQHIQHLTLHWPFFFHVKVCLFFSAHLKVQQNRVLVTFSWQCVDMCLVSTDLTLTLETITLAM